MTYSTTFDVFAIGDEIACLQPLRGDVLAIMGANSIQLLYGDGTTDNPWQVKRHSEVTNSRFGSSCDVGGNAVFVTDALPGERVVLRRVRRHRNFDEAVLESVLVTSADRVAPPCPHYGTCGGCALQHLAASAQLAFKQGQLLENLARLGGVQPQRLLEPLTGPVWGYRRRARLGIKLVPRKGRVVVGFRERAAPYVADLHECGVLAPPLGALIDPLATLVGGLSIAARVQGRTPQGHTR